MKALLDAPAGKQVIAYRELLSMPDFVALWGKTLGVETKLVRRLQPGVPEELSLELEETFAAAEEVGYWGHADKSVIHPKDLGLTRRELGTVEQWIKTRDWSTVLSGTSDAPSFF